MISFKQIEKASEKAVQISSLMSMLDRQEILEALIVPEKISPREFRKAIGLLLEYSFVCRQQKNYSMHRLVQIATKAWLEEKQELGRWQKDSVSLLSRHFPDGSYGTWAVCEVMLPHAQKVLDCCPQSNMMHDGFRLLINVGRYQSRGGNAKSAASLYKRALKGSEKQLGPDHPNKL